MFKKIVILSFIFVVGACQTKHLQKEEQPDSKKILGDLPGEAKRLADKAAAKKAAAEAKKQKGE